MKIFEEAGIDRMKLFLDYASKRQQVINSNIANLETPGYQAKELNFEHIFREASLEQGQGQGQGLSLEKSHPGHFDGKPVLLRETGQLANSRTEALGNDLNNVDLDREMAQLAQNVLKFSAVAQLLQRKLATIRSAILGG